MLLRMAHPGLFHHEYLNMTVCSTTKLKMRICNNVKSVENKPIKTGSAYGTYSTLTHTSITQQCQKHTLALTLTFTLTYSPPAETKPVCAAVHKTLTSPGHYQERGTSVDRAPEEG